MMKTNLRIFALKECLTSSDISSLCFLEGLESKKEFQDSSAISILK